jgi:hypothetical protein
MGFAAGLGFCLTIATGLLSGVALGPFIRLDIVGVGVDDSQRGLAGNSTLLDEAAFARLEELVEGGRRTRVEFSFEDLHDLAPPQALAVEPLMLAANWTPELLAHSGGRPGLAEGGKHSVYGRWEALIEYDPEVLFISPCGFDLPRSLQEANSLQDRPGWRQLSAVRNGRVWVIDGNAYLNRPGPRLIDSLEILAHLTHPQIIERPEWSDPNHLPWAWLC